MYPLPPAQTACAIPISFHAHLLKQLIQTLLTCFALTPSTQCSSQWLLLHLSQSSKSGPSLLPLFFEKKQGLYACDAHYITNLTKMFTIILGSSPLLPIKKKNPPGKALFKILLAITWDFRECKCKRSGNRKPLMWGKKHFREKWIQQTWGTFTLLKKSLCTLLPNYFAS